MFTQRSSHLRKAILCNGKFHVHSNILPNNSTTRCLSFSIRKKQSVPESDQVKEIKLRVASEFKVSPDEAFQAFRNYAIEKNRWYGPRSFYNPQVYPQQIYLPCWVFQYGESCGYKVNVKISIDPTKQKALLMNLYGEEIGQDITEHEREPLNLTTNPEDFSQRDLKEKSRREKKLLKELKLDDENTLKELASVLQNMLKNQFQIQEHNMKVENISTNDITINCVIDHIKLNEYIPEGIPVENLTSLKEDTKKPPVDEFTSVYASTQFERRFVKRVLDNMDRQYFLNSSQISKVNYKLKWYQEMWDSMKMWFSKTAFKRNYHVDYYTVDWETSWSFAFDRFIPEQVRNKMNDIIRNAISQEPSEEEVMTRFASPKIEISSFDLEKTDFKILKKDLIYFPFYVKQDRLNFPHALKLFSPFHIKQKLKQYEHGEHVFHSFTNGIDASYVTGYVPYSFPKLFATYLIGTSLGWVSMFKFLTNMSDPNILLYGLAFSFITSIGVTTEQYYKPLLHQRQHRNFSIFVHNKYIANKPLQRIYSNAWKWCANPSDGNTALAIEINQGCDLYSLLELDPMRFSLYSQEEIRVQYKKMAMLYHPDLFSSKSNNSTSGEEEQEEGTTSESTQPNNTTTVSQEWTKEEIIERFKQINYAFSILGDPYKRELYHKHGATYFQYVM